jgi:hypothetical protein
MPEYTFQLRGWHAIVAVLALLVYAGGTMLVRVRTVDDGMRNAVREQLLNDYSGRSPKDLARIVAEARSGSPIESVPALVQRNVEFTSITAHGKFGGQVAHVRAEVTVDGGPPPDGRSIRYFCLSPKLGGGWMVVAESSPYRYYSELLP